MRAPQDQLFDRTIEFFPARGGHVGLGRLGGQDFLLSPPYAGQNWRVAARVPVHPNAEVDLRRGCIGPVFRHQP